jgi:DNA-binding HxlR family transcriptional regulator
MSDQRHDCDDHGERFVADCRIRIAADFFAHTWNPVVLTALRAGPRRRRRLRGEIGGISDKVLTETLRRLEAAGLVERAAYAEAPPRVDYALTPLGRSLVDGPIAALGRWTLDHGEQLADAQLRIADARSA